MPATKTQLINGAFQDSEGNVLANGYLNFDLNQDGSVSGVGNIASRITIKILLDANGNVATSPSNQYVWANDVILPPNSFYKVTGYTAAGQPAWGPNNQQVTSGGTGGGTFDLGTWVPNQVFSWSPPPQLISLQTNGTPNTDQLVENLIAGSHITLTPDSNGGTTIAATIPAGVSLQTNGTPNTSQTVENLIAGTNITLTADGAGGTTIAATSAGASFGAAATGPYFMGPGIASMSMPSASSSGINAGHANAIRIFRFVLPFGMTVARCTFLAQSNSNGVCSFAIYSKDGSTKLIDTGTFNSTGFSNPSIFTQTFTPVTLPAGVYWIAQTDSSGGGGWAISSFNIGATISGLIRGSSSSARGIYGRSPTASSGGVMPSSISVTSLVDDGDGTAVATLWESQ
jgi:hypothetical protein